MCSCKKNFSANQFIVRYKGDLIEGKEAKMRENELPESAGSFIFFFFWKSNLLAIDATKEHFASFGRLVNHSRHKANAKSMLLTIKNNPVIILVALRDIKSGE